MRRSTRGSRSQAKARPRRNPNALFWRVSTQTPWATPPNVLRAHGGSAAKARAALRRQRRAAKRQAGGGGGGGGSGGGRRSGHSAPRGSALPLAAAAPVAGTSRPMPPRLVASSRGPGRPHQPARRHGRMRRNPPGAVAGAARNLAGDFKGLGAALSDLGKHPKGFLWLGGGALGTVVGGGIINAQLGRFLPNLTPGTARMVNAATYAGTAILLSRFSKNPQVRRQMLAGGLAIALIEALKPGVTAPVVAVIPGVQRLVTPPSAAVAAQIPAAQADPNLQATAVAAATPWYKAGGKLNPMNWLAGDEDDVAGLGEDDLPPPVTIDGIAGPDGRMQSLVGADEMAGVAEDGGGAGGWGGGGAGISSDDGAPVGDLVSTYLGGLGCLRSVRSNGLTQIVRP